MIVSFLNCFHQWGRVQLHVARLSSRLEPSIAHAFLVWHSSRDLLAGQAGVLYFKLGKALRWKVLTSLVCGFFVRHKKDHLSGWSPLRSRRARRALLWNLADSLGCVWEWSETLAQLVQYSTCNRESSARWTIFKARRKCRSLVQEEGSARNGKIINI